MLFFLTGEIQTGKTRWLEQAIAGLACKGVGVHGVIAPGVWRVHQGVDEAGNPREEYEKLGIDNMLLPSRELVPFARRQSDALADGSYDTQSQSARAQLAWAIDDGAIERVNGHFKQLIAQAESETAASAARRAILVVDELGRLELLRGEGLTHAVELLERGASQAFPHALVVVRASLLDVARERFSQASWGGMTAIAPNDEGLAQLRAAFSLG